MFGQLVYSQTKKVVLSGEQIEGMPIQTVCIPANAPGRLVSKAARLLQRRGVRRVLAPPDFSGWKRLEEYGIRPVDTAAFLQAMAAPLALAALEAQGISPERATVVLTGKRVSKGLRDAALALCPFVAQLVISAPFGGTELAAYLRQEYGLPLLEQCPDPSLILMFSPVDWDGGMPVLRLCDGGLTVPGFSIGTKKPLLSGDCRTLPLLAALWESGRLVIGDLAVFPCEEA